MAWIKRAAKALLLFSSFLVLGYSLFKLICPIVDYSIAKAKLNEMKAFLGAPDYEYSHYI